MRQYRFVVKRINKGKLLKLDALDDKMLDSLDELATRWAARAEQVTRHSLRPAHSKI